MNAYRLLLMSCVAFLFTLATANAADKAEPVARPVSLSVGKTIRLQMSKKQAIQTVVVDTENVVKVAPVPGDFTTILVTGVAPGQARITLTGVDGKKEVCLLGRSAR
jgi:hypothetical protein